jgi:hypothetical protein
VGHSKKRAVRQKQASGCRSATAPAQAVFSARIGQHILDFVDGYLDP